MDRRGFLGAMAGLLASTKIETIQNLDRLIGELPAGAALAIEPQYSFLIQAISFANLSDKRVVTPSLAIGDQLHYTGLEIPQGPPWLLNLDQRGPGFMMPCYYQLEAEERIVLTGEPGTAATIHGIRWEHQKAKNQEFVLMPYAYWIKV